MNSVLIEEIGINKLENFLLKTKKIRPVLRKLDKYPIWDGELLFYLLENNFDKRNLDCRIPVQIKSELFVDEKKRNETYSVNVNDLEKYGDEGGVLFIKIIYKEDEDVGYYYMKNLMKGEINDILFEISSSQKTKNILLNEVITNDELIILCKNFKLHRECQMQLPKFLEKGKLEENSELHTFGYINSINDILRDEQYVYVKTNYNSFAYVGKMKYETIYNTNNVEVRTRVKKYYESLTSVYEKDSNCLMINDYVKIANNKLQININLNDESTLDVILNDLEFVLDLYQNKNIKIGQTDYVDFNFESEEDKILLKIKMVEDNIKYFKSAASILKSLNIPINLVKTKDIIKDEKNVCRINEIINNGLLMKISDINSQTIINPVTILGITILIYFVKQENGTYKGYDYLNDDFVYKKLVVEEEHVQLSRYFNLPCDILSNILLDEVKFIKEIKLCTKNEITISYINYLMLEFIKTYDITSEKKYLNIAQQINRILRKQREYYSEKLYKINKFQILKRLDKLTEENLSSIVRMKIKENNDLSFKCCCCLLLDEFEEFILYYDELGKDIKEIFKKWAILKFLPEKYQKRLNN